MTNPLIGSKLPKYPHEQGPVLFDSRLAHHPDNCKLDRPGHRVRAINAWHRCWSIPVLITPPPTESLSLPAFEQIFVMTVKPNVPNMENARPAKFVVHNPTELAELLEDVDFEAIFGRAHWSLWFAGLSCNNGFHPCFGDPYPCKDDVNGVIKSAGDYRSFSDDVGDGSHDDVSQPFPW